MNRHTKRLLALAGSALVGAFGAVALASPAQAHHPEITGTSKCLDNGKYEISWVVGHVTEQNRKMRVLKLSAKPDTNVEGLKELDEVDAGKTKTATQLVPGTTTEASLTVHGQWINTNGTETDIFSSATGHVKLDGTCEPTEIPKPTATGESTCDKFTITIANPQGGKTAEATITYGTQEKKVTVEPGKTEKVELSPSSETKAKVVFAGLDGAVVVEYKKPGDCADLPRTGDDTLTYVASGTGIAGLGVLVFFLARRRLVRLRRLAS